MTPTKDNRVVVLMTEAETKAVEDWMFANRIASRSEAIRQMISQFLAVVSITEIKVDAGRIDIDHLREIIKRDGFSGKLEESK